ncbi:MAG: 4-hydroxy-3-methylbut-2-enyl diphosphate reductase [Verrucomicrobia bacterium]|nr:4-hydroxy-3-methylbut-2-enyl diphosphate reductase [Verrucomicrobiota bacterium]
MRILRAEHLGMCFGVRDAIHLALTTATQRPLTVLGELVHNENVLESLRREGVEIKHQLDNVTTSTVMITAHGASEKALDRVRQRGHNIVEATCPLVHHAHRAVRQLVREGYHPVIVGKRDHVEVRGIVEDLTAFDVILSEADVELLQERPRFGVAAQTTQPIQKVRQLVAMIQRRFPNSEVRFADTVCQPTKQRQTAAVELARRCDVVIVIGGAHSNNTRELVATCRRFCERVYHVQTAQDLREDWFYDAQTAGITAGTSTPDYLINEVEGRLKEIASTHAFPTEMNAESADAQLQDASKRGSTIFDLAV